jgi:hypothetical protein
LKKNYSQKDNAHWAMEVTDLWDKVDGDPNSAKKNLNMKVQLALWMNKMLETVFCKLKTKASCRFQTWQMC